jgi:hypothetical protein
MAFIKTMTIDDYYSKDEAIGLANLITPLNFKQYELGKQIEEFNVVSDNIDEIFSSVLPMKVSIEKENSGIFRFPDHFIHFENFSGLNEWLFVVALQQSIFDIYEHKSGIKSALEDYRFNYRNLFEWDLTLNHQLEPGQGIFFRPWLFHSFNSGLIQIFRLKEI